MNETKQLIGGVEWIVAPSTERVTMKWAGQSWPIDAVKVESCKGTFFVCHYEYWAWNPRRRPFDRNWHLAIDGTGRVLVQAPSRDFVLWSLAAGRSWKELPDCWTTASGGFDDQPRSQQHSQHSYAQPSEDRPTPRPAASPRQSITQRLTKALGITRDDDDSAHGARRGPTPPPVKESF